MSRVTRSGMHSFAIHWSADSRTARVSGDGQQTLCNRCTPSRTTRSILVEQNGSEFVLTIKVHLLYSPPTHQLPRSHVAYAPPGHGGSASYVSNCALAPLIGGITTRNQKYIPSACSAHSATFVVHYRVFPNRSLSQSHPTLSLSDPQHRTIHWHHDIPVFL